MSQLTLITEDDYPRAEWRGKSIIIRPSRRGDERWNALELRPTIARHKEYGAVALFKAIRLIGLLEREEPATIALLDTYYGAVFRPAGMMWWHRGKSRCLTARQEAVLKRIRGEQITFRYPCVLKEPTAVEQGAPPDRLQPCASLRASGGG